MNERNDRVRAHAKQCLLRRPLPSDQEIPGYWENLESKVYNVPIKGGHGPFHLTYYFSNL